MNAQIAESCKDTQLVIFDLDGTLFHSDLSFAPLRTSLGIEQHEPLLEYIETLDKAQQALYQEAIREIEEKFAREGNLHSAVPQLLERLIAQNIELAIWTRNSQKATEISLGKHLNAFQIIATRENAKAKPHPQGLQHILEKAQCPIDNALFIGDSHFDILAAQTAGIKTLIINSKLKEALPRHPKINFLQTLDDLIIYLGVM